MERLTAVDASFLHQERRASHMHVGAIFTFEGPVPSYDDLLDHVDSRLHLVPRYRQILATPQWQAGRPLWVDDPSFRLDYHVRQTGLPSPGSEVELRRLAGRIFSQRLDRSKPLWEMWLVEGLAENRFALVSKTHHALVDGIAGVDLMTVIFDLSREPEGFDETPPWVPEPSPSQAELIAEGVKDAVAMPFGLARRALEAGRRPRETARTVFEAAQGLAEVAWAELNPAPATPLNVEIGPHREIRWTQASLEDFRTIKRTLGGTVNDVVLSVVTGALGSWLRERGEQTAGLELRALVPVSIRSKGQRGELGNRLALVRAALPVYCEDPSERLRLVKRSMGDLKRSKQALGAEVLTGLEHFAPPTLLAQASRMNFSTRLFNLLVTNVPGPQFPLYVLGRELEQLIPVPFLAEGHSLAIAAMSYNRKVEFGLLADFDAEVDPQHISELIDQALAELLELAGGEKPDQSARKSTGRRRTQRTQRVRG